jgi:hypothetical protein
MTRRSFLISLLSLLLAHKKAFSLSRQKITDEAILRGLLDALIPSDSTPGAQEAHLYEKLTGLISKDTKRKGIYATGLLMVRREVEQKSGKQTDWDAVLRKIAPSRFFRVLRWDALRLFYSNPVGWNNVDYEGPPLVGYDDYHKCGS